MSNWTYDNSYRLTSPFGMRIHPVDGVAKFHRGVDIVTATATSPIYAFVAGVVTHAKEGVTGSGFGNYGNVVAIKDSKGYLHVYAHLSMITVKVGQTVDRNQMIGRQGNTGKSTGAHLHYEIRKTSTPQFGYTATESGVVEPTQYLVDFYAKEEKPLTEKQRTVTRNTNTIYNGKKIDDGVLIDGVVFVPVRVLAESLGAKVDWDKTTYTAKITK